MEGWQVSALRTRAEAHTPHAPQRVVADNVLQRIGPEGHGLEQGRRDPPEHHAEQDGLGRSLRISITNPKEAGVCVCVCPGWRLSLRERERERERWCVRRERRRRPQPQLPPRTRVRDTKETKAYFSGTTGHWPVARSLRPAPARSSRRANTIARAGGRPDGGCLPTGQRSAHGRASVRATSARARTRAAAGLRRRACTRSRAARAEYRCCCAVLRRTSG